jgi:hypothetical protein
VTVRVSGGRAVRAGHRRAGLGTPGCRRGSAVLRRALSTLKVTPSEVVTDAAPVYCGVLDELIPSAWHHVEQYANKPIEADHSRLKHRLRPMRGLRTDTTAQVVIAGHAFIQNLRRWPLRTRRRSSARSAGRRGVYRTRRSDLTTDPALVQHGHRSGDAMAPTRLYDTQIQFLKPSRRERRKRAGS